MRSFAGIVLLALLVSHSNWGLAQSSGDVNRSQDAQIPFTIKKFGTKEGLPQNQVVEIIKSQRGELILSTGNGIVLYNGTEFYPFETLLNKSPVIYNRIMYVQDRLFGISGCHIEQLSPSLQQYRFKHEDIFTLSDDALFKIDEDGKIYKSISFKDSFELIYSTGISQPKTFFCHGDKMIISTENSTYAIDAQTKTKRVIADNRLNFICASPDTGGSMCSYGNQLYSISKDLKVQLIITLADGTHINDLAYLDNLRFWMATSKGMVFRSGDSFQYFDQSFGIPTATTVHYDANEDCLFLGTLTDGFYQLVLKSTRTTSTLSGENPSINNVILSGDNKIYVAASNDRFYEMKGDVLYPIFDELGSGSCSISSLNDTLYLGIWNRGVFRAKDGQVIDRIFGDGKQYKASLYDRNGTYWFGMDDGLYTGTNPTKLTRCHTQQLKKPISSLYEMKDGTICVGERGAFYLISPQGKIKKYATTVDDRLPRDTRCFFDDNRGNLWIGTYGEGLFRLTEENGLTHINAMRNCELSNDIFTLVVDQFQNIVMTSNQGMYLVALSKLQDFANRKIHYLIPFILEEESGMLSSEFNGVMNENFTRLPNNQLLFPSIKGVIKYTPRSMAFRKLHLYHHKLTVDDATPKHPHVFGRETVSIRFTFFAPNYRDHFNLHYQFKLSSSNKKNPRWGELQKNGEITYTLLPPGDYVLHVRALDGFNDDNPEVLTYKFTIEPYFYETSWFRAVSILLVLILIFLFVLIWTNRVKAKEKRELLIKNTIAGFRLQAIQAKMNPHFIFNSLNGIYHLMARKNYQEAETQLLEFSKFLRKFIEQDSRNSNTLSYEFNFLREYLNVEKKRIRHGFDIRIELPESLENRLIPASILMPFVENAVHHGIFHSSKKCFILIQAIASPQGMQINIVDDGIGLKASKEINSERENHESKGIHFVKRKIELFEDLYSIKIQLQIEEADLGTNVSLFIPFYD